MPLVWLAIWPAVFASAADVVTLVSTGAVSKYSDTGTEAGVAWRAPAFDGRAWPSGPAQPGSGDGDEATVIRRLPDGGPPISTEGAEPVVVQVLQSPITTGIPPAPADYWPVTPSEATAVMLPGVQFTDAGSYSVIVSNLAGVALSSNVTLTVTLAWPFVTWPTPAPITYGTPLSNAQLNAQARVSGSFTYSPPAGTVLRAGEHILSVTFQPAQSNLYTTVSTQVNLVVEQAFLTIRADDKSKVAGQFNPPLTATYIGLVAGDTPDRLDSPGALATTATTASPPGTYPITVSGASDPNYTIAFVDGTLTVLPAEPYRPGAFDPSFVARVDEWTTVNVLVNQPDGKLLIAGSFQHVNGVPRDGLARLLPNGAVDTNFNATFLPDGHPSCLALQGDGRILVGGSFTNVNGAARCCLARLNSDGSVDPGFAPPSTELDHVLELLAQPDGKVLATGHRFDSGLWENRVVRFLPDGSVDASFGPTDVADSSVAAMALQADGKILLAGGFTAVNGVSRHGLARLNANGTVDLSFVPDIYTVWAPDLALQPDGRILVVGSFIDGGGESFNGLLRLAADGSVDWTCWTAFYDCAPESVALQSDGKIIVGGYFTAVMNVSENVARSGLVRLNPDASVDLSFDPGIGVQPITDATVNSIVIQDDGKIVIAGSDFISYDGFACASIARLIGGTPALPVITRQPVGQTVSAGQTASFSVTATGTPPLGYQWQKDAAALLGQTNSSLILSHARFSDAGAYRVVVSNPAGSVTSAVAVLTVIPSVDPANDDQGWPAVASDGTDFFVVWYDRRNQVGYEVTNSTRCDIYGARVTADGRVLDPDGILIGRHSHWPSPPAVGFDGTNYLVVWTYSPGTIPTNICGRRVSRDGVVLDSPAGFRIGAAGSEFQIYPSLAFNGHVWLVVWSDQRARINNFDVYGARVTPSGQVLDPTNLPISSGVGAQLSPSVASLEGEFLVIWEDVYPTNNAINGVRVTQAGVVSAPVTIVRGTARYPGQPHLAVTGTNYLAVWHEGFASSNSFWWYWLMGSRLSAAGTPLDTPPFAVRTNAGIRDMESRLTATGTDAWAVWTDASSDIWGTRIGLNHVIPPAIPISLDPSPQFQPGAGWNGSKVLVAWRDLRDSGYTGGGYPQGDIYATLMSPAGQVLDTNGFLVSSVVRQVPVVTWNQPAAIVYGTPLSGVQLNAASSVPGTFTYSPPAGTLLNAGQGQTLSVTFTPQDTSRYQPVTVSVSLDVQPAPLTITADDKTKIQGQPNPPLTATHVGLVAGDTAASLDTPVILTTTATTSSPAGTYPIVASGASDENYRITFVNGTLTVWPASANLVTSTADSGPGSLRAVLSQATGGTVQFAVTGAVVLTSGELVINGPVHLEGPGAHLLSIERSLVPSTPEFRIFNVGASDITISGLTIRHGRVGESSDYTEGAGILNQGGLVLRRCVVSDHTGVGEYTRGAGICNQYGATLVAEQCTFARNTALGYYGEGGAIYNYGLLALTNCTFSSNSVGMWGGALHNDMLSDGVVIESCTFTRNSASFGSGLFNRGNPPFDVSPVSLRNTIVAGNAGTDIGHCSLIESGGYNLIGTIADPYSSLALPFVPGPGDRTNVTGAEIRLGPLQNNGGPTPTHALLRHSPALDTGPETGFPLTDQRGVARPFGPRCDIGAFEVDTVFINTPPLIACPGSIEWEANYTNAATGTLTVTVSDNDGDDLQVVWTVEGAAYRTNVVPSRGTPTSASVSLTLTLATGTHVVSAAVSDAEAGPISCTTTVQVLPPPAMPPVITRQPVSRTVFVGQTATFTVGAVGTLPLSYRWRHNGVTIPGATNATLVLWNVQSNQAGTYSAIVTNLLGAALSSNAVLTVEPGPVRPGSLDFTFDPSVGGQFLGLAQGNVDVKAIAVQPDGKVIIGGQFLGVDGVPQAKLARLNADGSLDPAFRPPALAQSYADLHLVLQPDDKVLVTDGVEVMRLNPNGSRDELFQQEGASNCWVAALQPDGKIVIGGGTYQSGFVDRLNPDGRRDSSFQRHDFPQFVRAIALQLDGRILAAGGPSSLNWVARLNADGTLDAGFSATVAGEIHALAPAADGKVVLAGTFRNVNDFERHGVARLQANGTLDTAFIPRIASVDWHIFVYALATQADGSVILGGTSPHVYPNGWSWPGYWLLLKLNPDGGEDTDFTAELGGLIRLEGCSVRALAVRPNGGILAGGDLPNSGLVRLSASGTPDTTFNPSLQGQPGMVEALSRQPDGKVLALGQFTSVAGTPRPRFARLNVDGTLDPRFLPDLPPGYLVGSYTVQSDGKVVVSAGYGQPMLAELFRLHADGSRDFSFNPVVRRSNELAYVLRLFTQPDDRILVAGNFDSVNGVTRRHLARLHRDGTLDPTFDLGAGLMTQYDYAWINALVLQPDGKILLGGWFEGVNGVLRRSLARLHSDGSVDLPFYAPYIDQPQGPVSGVVSLARQPDGRVLVGVQRETFPESGPALVRLNADGSLDPNFHLGAGITAATDVGYVNALLLQPDGKILVGGAFDSYDGEDLPNLVRLHPDGQVDLSFTMPWAFELEEVEPWEIGGVHALELQPDGRILIGGWFKSIAGVRRWGIARLNNDVVMPPPWVRREIARPTVQLLAAPPASVSAYAVEDRVQPTAVIAHISHGGVFDAATGKVKFGPFYDHEPRMLSYAVLIPPGCIHGVCGLFTFAGTASADGINTPITGDAVMLVAGLHPADLAPADSQLSIGEVTAYGAAWRRGETWPAPPVPIPIDYATRAAFLWRGGECYQIDLLATNAPLCWVDCGAPSGAGSPSAVSPAANVSGAQRQMAHAFVPGEPQVITLSVSPGSAQAYAVEDQAPLGWAVSHISDGGELDAVNRKAKWGPFFDNLPRILSYHATPPLSASGTVTLAGTISRDGASAAIDGPHQLIAGARLLISTSPGTGTIALALGGELGQRYVLEASSDLLTWTDLVAVTNLSGRVSFQDPIAASLSQRFYRARLEPSSPAITR